MVNLLLDEHVSPEVANGLHRRFKTLVVRPLAQWEEGRFLSQSDELILQEAARQRLTLVTYDLKTIPPLLKAWAETSRNHGGVIFVDHKTIPPSNFGGLVHALRRLSRESAKWDWSNRICFLRRA